MQLSDTPRRFPKPFASGASGTYVRDIPTEHVAATGTDAPASLNDGFPPETFTPLASGGIPPNGADMNGILRQLTAWARWQAAGGPATFNAEFVAAVGGYPRGARLASAATAGVEWISTADNNTTDPDSLSAANWIRVGKSDALLASNGYEIRPSGIIEQWGSVYIGRDSTATIAFPIPFPIVCWNIQLSWQDSTIGSGSPQGSSGFGAQSLSGFIIYNDGNFRTHHWRALGQ